MDSLAGIPFFRILGEVPAYSQGLEDVTRPYEAGVALRRAPAQAPAVELIAEVDLASAVAVRTHLDTVLPGMCGKLGTLIQRGTSRLDVAILGFRAAPARPCAVIVGGINVGQGQPGFWLVVNFQVRYAGVPS